MRCKLKLPSALILSRTLFVLAGCLGVWLGHAGLSDENQDEPQLLRIDAIFGLMANQIVDTACNAPEFKACFDVPYTECSRELRKMLTECRSGLTSELPDLVAADEVDPIIEETYACVVPKWDELIKDRRIESEACEEAERSESEGSQ